MPSCTTVCLLTDFALDLPFDLSTLQADEEQVFLFSQAMSKVPKALAGVQIQQAGLTANPGQILIQMTREHTWITPEIFIHSNDDALADVVYQVAVPKVSGADLSVMVTASHWLDLPTLAGKTLTITITDHMSNSNHYVSFPVLLIYLCDRSSALFFYADHLDYL